MRILLNIAIVIGILVVLLLIIAFFSKKDYAIEREIVINKPRQEVFNYIKYLRNQQNYSKWVMMDPDMEKDFKGTDGEVGFVYSWKSNNKDVGQGEQEISHISE